MNVDGKCLCGQIESIADIDPTTATICHCTDCQVNSVTAFGYVVGAINDSFKLMKTGANTVYVKRDNFDDTPPHKSQTILHYN